MNMKKLLKMGAKALRLQMKKYPNKRFKDDSGEYVSFNDIADQIDALLSVIYNTNQQGMGVHLLGNGKWVVERRDNKNVRNHRH